MLFSLTFQMFLTLASASHGENNLLMSIIDNVNMPVQKKPDFCKNLDCPSFTLVNKTDTYEERLYATSNWVSTNITGVDYKIAQTQMFYRLFDYIQGKNSKGQKIAMTVPVITHIIPGPGPACENNFTMSFYISVRDPPVPSDGNVYLSQLPQQTAFVRSFGGFASLSDWLTNAETLASSLMKDSKSFVKDSFFTAGYNSPFEVINRHNEVWFVGQK